MGKKDQTKPTDPKTDPASSQSILQIAEIRDGLVIMNDGSFRGVLMCRSINFDLMSYSEKEAVEFNYQNFLNSLYFPIQILVRSRRVDINKYLQRLNQFNQKQTNMLLGLLTDDYLDFVADLIDNVDIMDKTFFVVVPYFVTEITKENIVNNTQNFFSRLVRSTSNKQPPVVISENSLNQAKTEIRHRLSAVSDNLRNCGVKNAVLGTQELIELFYESYNPDSSGQRQLNDLRDLTVPVITRRGEPQVAPSPAVASVGTPAETPMMTNDPNTIPNSPTTMPPAPTPNQPPPVMAPMPNQPAVVMTPPVAPMPNQPPTTTQPLPKVEESANQLTKTIPNNPS